MVRGLTVMHGVLLSIAEIIHVPVSYRKSVVTII